MGTTKLIKNKEVFVICNDEDSEGGEMVFEVFERLSELQGFMATLDTQDVDSLKVINGVICTAEFLPDNFHGCTPHLILIDELCNKIVEISVSSTQQLASELETVWAAKENFNITSISDILILYGYEIKICLSIDEDSIDEEVSLRCKNISLKIEKMKNEK